SRMRSIFPSIIRSAMPRTSSTFSGPNWPVSSRKNTSPAMPDSTPPFIPPFDFYEHVLARWYPWSAEGWNGSACHDTAMTVLKGFLVAAACGWIGCYLILQGMALVGDAISHTVLLGIVVAFLLTGEVSGLATFVG